MNEFDGIRLPKFGRSSRLTSRLNKRDKDAIEGRCYGESPYTVKRDKNRKAQRTHKLTALALAGGIN